MRTAIVCTVIALSLLGAPLGIHGKPTKDDSNVCSKVDCTVGPSKQLIPGDVDKCEDGIYCECNDQNVATRQTCSFYSSLNPDKQECEIIFKLKCNSWLANEACSHVKCTAGSQRNYLAPGYVQLCEKGNYCECNKEGVVSTKTCGKTVPVVGSQKKYDEDSQECVKDFDCEGWISLHPASPTDTPAEQSTTELTTEPPATDSTTTETSAGIATTSTPAGTTKEASTDATMETSQDTKATETTAEITTETSEDSKVTGTSADTITAETPKGTTETSAGTTTTGTSAGTTTTGTSSDTMTETSAGSTTTETSGDTTEISADTTTTETSVDATTEISADTTTTETSADTTTTETSADTTTTETSADITTTETHKDTTSTDSDYITTTTKHDKDTTHSPAITKRPTAVPASGASLNAPLFYLIVTVCYIHNFLTPAIN